MSSSCSESVYEVVNPQCSSVLIKTSEGNHGSGHDLFRYPLISLRLFLEPSNPVIIVIII